MFTMKKAIAFMMALIMVLSCMPISLATDGDNQVTDTVQNTEVRLIPLQDETAETTEEPSAKEFTYNIIGAEDVSLSKVLDDLAITAEGETEAFMAEIENVSVSNDEVLRLTQTEEEDDWVVRSLKEAETPETLTISMQDGTEYSIVAASEGTTEVSTENNAAVISTVDDLYLPEAASAYAENVEGEQGETLISAVQQQAEGGEGDTAYQTFSIGLENVDETEYAGFEVAVNLEEDLTGKDFKLYQVQDGEATDITDTLQLNSETTENGLESVSGFSFTTDGSAEYVLSYALETYYTAFDGKTFDIRVDYDAESGIPSGAELQVREILEGGEEYDQYLSDAAEQLGVSSDSVTFARFFDIEIIKDGEKVEPSKPVQVKISYQDPLELTGSAQLSVVHFADEGTEVIRDVDVTADGTELTYEQESFSVTGTIITGAPADGQQVVVVIRYKEHYYTVFNDGTMLEVDDAYDPVNQIIQLDIEYPLLWTYQFEHATNFDYHNLKIPSKGIAFAFGLPYRWYYRYINPKSPIGYSEENEQNSDLKQECAIWYDQNHILGYDNGQKYIGVSEEGGLHIIGQQNLSNAAEIYFATLAVSTPVDNSTHDNHMVDHIDISVDGESKIKVPLAFGNYYDENGNIIFTSTKSNHILEMQPEVSITSDDMRKATITATDKHTGEVLPNVFYVTGYSQNQKDNENDPDQMRIEGSFKVSNIPDAAGADNDPDVRQARLDHPILYTVSVTKDIRVEVKYEGQQLYDADGRAMVYNVPVSLSGSFDYWDHRNECPPLHYGYNAGWDFDPNTGWLDGKIRWNRLFSWVDNIK